MPLPPNLNQLVRAGTQGLQQAVKGAAAAQIQGGTVTAGNVAQRLGPAGANTFTSMSTATSRPGRQFAAGAGVFSNVGGAQQARTKFTLVEPKLTEPLKDQELVTFFSNFFNELKKLHPELANARPRGVHATTAENVRGIIEKGGFDFNLTKKNFNFSEDGPGVYITDDAFLAIYYARNAFVKSQKSKAEEGEQKDGEAAAAPEESPLQLVAFFDEPLKKLARGERIPAEEEETDTYREHGKETHIPTAAIKGDTTLYIAVPMPPFSHKDSEDVTYALHTAMHKD